MRKKSIPLPGYILFLLGFCSGCLSFRESDKNLIQRMKKEGLDYEIHHVSSEAIRYLWYKNEDPTVPVVLFIHGAPGSSSSFLPYLTDERLREGFSIILVDRPGYGYSDYGNYRPIPEQYDAIQLLLTHSKINENVIPIGHSFGGTIAGFIAIQNPDWLSGAIMIAPAIDPEQEKYLWFGKLALYKSTRWLAPRSLRVAADEKYSHEDELKTFINDWDQIKKPIFHIHGDADGLVPYGNVTFSKENIPNKWLEIKTFENKGHLIPFKEREAMVDEIIRFTQGLE